MNSGEEGAQVTGPRCPAAAVGRNSDDKAHGALQGILARRAEELMERRGKASPLRGKAHKNAADSGVVRSPPHFDFGEAYAEPAAASRSSGAMHLSATFL